MNTYIKHILSVVAFVSAIVIGFIALFLPPQGLIDSSVLWWTSQLLVFTSGMLGIDLNIKHLQSVGINSKGKKHDREVEDEEE